MEKKKIKARRSDYLKMLSLAKADLQKLNKSRWEAVAAQRSQVRSISSRGTLQES